MENLNLRELKSLAKQNNINITFNGKYKTKNQLIEELNESNNKNEKYKVKHIIIPKNSKDTIINIYMTQKNVLPSHEIVSDPQKTHHNITIPSNIPIAPLLLTETPEEKILRQERTKIAREEAKERNKPKDLSIQEKNMIALQEAVEKRKKKLEGGYRQPDNIKDDDFKLYKGEGITDWFKNAYSVITNPTEALYKIPKQVSDNLKKYGNNIVVKIIICRVPIKGVIKILLDGITLGQFSKEAKNYNYDDVFHLYAILILDNGKYLLTERNQRVVLELTDRNKANVKDYMTINSNVKLNRLFDNAVNLDGKNIWRYDPINHNCQNYITTLLKGSNLFTDNLDVFINQETKNLLPKTSKYIARATTDLASIAENLFKGGKKKKVRFSNKNPLP